MKKGEPGNDGKDGKDGKDAITYIPCIFNNYDGTKLYEFYYEKGSTIAYDGPTPVKTTIDDSGKTLNWTFTGWDKSLEDIQKPTIFTAQFEYLLTCTFLNYDGSLLATTKVRKGESATYDGPTPKKDSIDKENGIIEKFEFLEWDKPIKNITEDTTFTATFSSTDYFRCRFFNYNGNLLYTTSTFSGGMAKYDGGTPRKEQIANGNVITNYTFTGWDKSLSNITEPTDFYAEFESNDFIGYKVTFMGPDNNNVLYSEYFEENTCAIYPYETPWSYDDESVTMFFGWSESIASITKETTVHMVMKTISRKLNGEYPQTKVANVDLIETLDSLPNPTSGYYIEYDGNRYERRNSNYYKVEPIRWRYLGEEDGGALMLSEKILDAKPYNSVANDEKGNCTNNYKKSEIRAWLNDAFLDRAFEDPSLIKTTAVDNSVSSTGRSDNSYVCETTNDKVFLLSFKEATNPAYGFLGYNDYSDSRIAHATDYTKSYVIAGSDYDNTYDWWLRSPFDQRYNWAFCAFYNGYIGSDNVIYSYYGVRPALRMTLN